MSFDFNLFKIETKQKQLSSDKSFFENEENLVPFSNEQLSRLNQELSNFGFENTSNNPQEFYHPEYEASALLTDRGLYFSISSDQEAVFEIAMFASKLTDTKEFAIYDMQENNWIE